MAKPFERPFAMTIDDLYRRARENKDFEIIEQGIIDHPEWLTTMPDGQKWGIIHQIVYHGNVGQLNQLLALQRQNPKFLLLSKTGDNKTVLDIAREEMKKNDAMYLRVERLAMMDELLTYAKARNWKMCQNTLNHMPDIVNEKPPYRRFFLIHQITYIGDQKVFDEFNQRYQFDLNLLSNDDKSVLDIAREAGHEDFVHYIKRLKGKVQQEKSLDQFSRESRTEERAHARDCTAVSSRSESVATPVQTDDTTTNITLTESDLLDSLTCPLSGKMLKVPVVASDGYTYEKENILKYFETHDQSPVTNEVFKNKDLQRNFTIERILKTLALRAASPSKSLSSSMPTHYRVQTGDTLTKIAEQKEFDLDQMKAANPELQDVNRLVPNQMIKLPLIQQLIDSTLEKEPRVSNESVTVFQHFNEQHSEPTLIPTCAPNQNLSDVRQKLQAIFMRHDVDGDGFMSLEEFETFLSRLNLTMNHQDVRALFKEMNGKHEGKITFQEFYRYFEEMINGEKATHSQSELDLLAAFLKADRESKCEMAGISQFINRRWEKFNNFKRVGKTGKLVMVGGAEAMDVLPGEYSLVDLITWSDIVPQNAKPKLARISNVRWIESSDPKSESGRLLFPKTFFDVRLPVERGTSDKLAYYGCCLANESQVKVSLFHRHAIQDFTYSDSYYRDYVRGRAGLERHAFAHLDCPFQEDNGFFILAKFSEENENELHLTAFRIPLRHTLYVPPLTIHSNDYLKGTWRTMLSDAAQIDHVLLERERHDGEADQISFDFMS